VPVRVAVDFGTSSSCVVMSTQARGPELVAFDGSPLLSSAVYAAPDGTLFVGQEADRQAAVDPSRYEPHPKRRIDEGELLLGDSVWPVLDVIRGVLRRAVDEARKLAGGAAVEQLVLTHPADWGAVRSRLLRQAAAGLARNVSLVPEPAAAAVHHAATFSQHQPDPGRTLEVSGRAGDTIAVLDVGGGTVDVSVVRRAPGPERSARQSELQVLATRGDPTFGGADVDQALLEHIGSLLPTDDGVAWTTLIEGRELSERRRRRVLRQDVRGAKETLSRHSYTDVPMPSPFSDVHVTRQDLERLVNAPLGRTVELARAVISDSGLRPAQLNAIFLVGGSSRIPMVSRLVHERLGVLPTTLDQPETVVARGALRAVRGEAPPAATHQRPVTPPQGTARTYPPARTGAAHPHTQHQQHGAQGVGMPTTSGVVPPAQPAGYRDPPRSGRPAVASGQQQPSSGDTGRPRGRHRAGWWITSVALGLVVGITAGWFFLFGPGAQQDPEGKHFAQFHYSFVAPEGWVQTEDNAAARQVVIKSGGRTEVDDLVVVQENELSYDAVQKWDRFAGELREKIEDRQAERYSDFDGDTRYAGKHAVSFTEHKSNATVAWYALASGSFEVLVGCQYTESKQRVLEACEQVVGTLEIRQ